MKVFKFFPILAVALLIPSFAEAQRSDRGQRRQYSDRDHDRYDSDRANYGRRAGSDRGRGYDRGRNRKTTYGRRGGGHYDDHRYCDDRSHNHRYGHSRRGSHRRGRRGIHFGGVIVIRF